ncbi:MAG: hypothetical protein J1E38_04825 [Paramuribaculum sp.]|nr:hypothetical protein [Paramuribaculum sp.]
MKRVKFKANGDIIIEYFASDEDDNMTVPSFQEIISTKDIYGLEIRNKNLIVRLKKSKLGFLIIPVNSLNEKTLEKLRQRIQSINVDS